MKFTVSMAVIGLASLLSAGCTRAPEPQFVASEAVDDLSSLHQQNLSAGLTSMFGTPVRPRLRTEVPQDALNPDFEKPQSTSGEGGESDANGSDEGDAKASRDPISIVNVDRLAHGAQIYQKRCSGCHGVGGDGNGPAAPYLRPKPRDYRRGIFKFTSTPYGERPARQDLVRTIRRGAKGTSMPAFLWMSNEDLDAVVDYVIYLALRGSVEEMIVYVADDYDDDEMLDAEEFSIALVDEIDRWAESEQQVIKPISAEPAYDFESVQQGRRLFVESSCYSCHGDDATGQTEWLSPEFLAAQATAEAQDRVQINLDAWGEPAPAANITSRLLHGGRRPLDIYRRIYTGINGTPMPQFGNLFAEEPDNIWHLVHYVLHVVDGGAPDAGLTMAQIMQEAAAAAHSKSAAASDSTTSTDATLSEEMQPNEMEQAQVEDGRETSTDGEVGDGEVGESSDEAQDGQTSDGPMNDGQLR